LNCVRAVALRFRLSNASLIYRKRHAQKNRNSAEIPKYFCRLLI